MDRCRRRGDCCPRVDSRMPARGRGRGRSLASSGLRIGVLGPWRRDARGGLRPDVLDGWRLCVLGGPEVRDLRDWVCGGCFALLPLISLISSSFILGYRMLNTRFCSG